MGIRKPALAFQMNHEHKVSQYLVNQINEIIEYKKQPNSKCAKIKRNHTEPDLKTVKQYFLSRIGSSVETLERSIDEILVSEMSINKHISKNMF